MSPVVRTAKSGRWGRFNRNRMDSHCLAAHGYRQLVNPLWKGNERYNRFNITATPDLTAVWERQSLAGNAQMHSRHDVQSFSISFTLFNHNVLVTLFNMLNVLGKNLSHPRFHFCEVRNLSLVQSMLPQHGHSTPTYMRFLVLALRCHFYSSPWEISDC